VKQKRVLIIDDDADIRTAVADILEDEGFDVATAENGIEGLQVLETGPRPNVILLDIMMPQLDGWGFMEEMRARERHASIPVVVFSAHGNPADIAAKMKTAGSLRKPLRLEELLETVAQCAA
jgi:two-component system, chemotaxis family, chemotaxis protein CheY